MRSLHIDKSAKECPIAPIILISFYISVRLSKQLLPKSPLGGCLKPQITGLTAVWCKAQNRMTMLLITESAELSLPYSECLSPSVAAANISRCRCGWGFGGGCDFPRRSTTEEGSSGEAEATKDRKTCGVDDLLCLEWLTMRKSQGR